MCGYVLELTLPTILRGHVSPLDGSLHQVGYRTVRLSALKILRHLSQLPEGFGASAQHTTGAGHFAIAFRARPRNAAVQDWIRFEYALLLHQLFHQRPDGVERLLECAQARRLPPELFIHYFVERLIFIPALVEQRECFFVKSAPRCVLRLTPHVSGCLIGRLGLCLQSNEAVVGVWIEVIQVLRYIKLSRFFPLYV